MLKKKIIPVFLASVLTVSGTTGFVTEAFSENAYAAEEVHTTISKSVCQYRSYRHRCGHNDTQCP